MSTDRPDVRLFENRLEVLKKVSNLRMEIAKRFYSGVSCYENYMKGALELHLHLMNSFGVCLRYRDRNSAEETDEGHLNEFPMLVEIGEIPQKREKRESVVRLKLLDQCDVFDREMFETPGPVFLKMALTVIDRKLGSILFGMSTGQGQVKDQIIEGGTNMEQDLAGTHQGRLPDAILEKVESFLRIQVRIGNDIIQCLFPDSIDHQFKRRQFFPCPVHPDLGQKMRA